MLTELDPEEPDIAFGLCDLGMGFPELGCVRFSELESVRGKLGLPIERDLYFTADRPLSAYADEAYRLSRLLKSPTRRQRMMEKNRGPLHPALVRYVGLSHHRII